MRHHKKVTHHTARQSSWLLLVTAIVLALLAPHTASASSPAEANAKPATHSQQLNRYVEFASPTRNIACSISYDPGSYNYNRCDIREKSYTSPPRPNSCPRPYSWGKHVSIYRQDVAFACASEPATGDTPPILRYGQSARRGHIWCTSRVTGMVCRNLNTTHGYKLSRASVKFF